MSDQLLDWSPLKSSVERDVFTSWRPPGPGNDGWLLMVWPSLQPGIGWGADEPLCPHPVWDRAGGEPTGGAAVR